MRLSFLAYLALVCLLAACRPLPPPADPVAEPSAAQLAAPTTAPAATDTITSTPPRISTETIPEKQAVASTPAESPVPMPDLAFAAITADDLPDGFQVGQAGSFPYEVTQSYVVANGFFAERPGYAQELSGVVIWLSSPAERSRFDRSLADGTWLADLLGADPASITERYAKLADLPPVGDVVTGLTNLIGEDYLWNNAPRSDMVIWRRGDVGALVLLVYLRGDDDLPPIADIARRLDERIAWALAADLAGRSGSTPTPAPRLAPAPRPARTPIVWNAALTPTLTLADLPSGFELASEQLGSSELTIAADAPYPAVSTFSYQRFVYIWVLGFVVSLPDSDARAEFDAALAHPDALVEELCGLDVSGLAGIEPSYTDLTDLGDAARQATLTDPATFLGPVTYDLVCLRRAGLGACVVVQSLYPKREPHVRDLARLLDERMRLYEPIQS